MQAIPSGGTIPRCVHSVYWPAGDEIAFCCGLCNPAAARPTGAPANITLPQRHRKDDDALYANKNQRGHCPKCASGAHVVNDDGTWTCADCGENFKSRRAVSPKTKEMIGADFAQRWCSPLRCAA